MTRKDYVAIADIIDGARDQGLTLEEVAEKLADTMEKDNPRFDRARFLEACGF